MQQNMVSVDGFHGIQKNGWCSPTVDHEVEPPNSTGEKIQLVTTTLICIEPLLLFFYCLDITQTIFLC